MLPSDAPSQDEPAGEGKKYSGDNVAGPARSVPYGSSRLAGPITLVDTAAEIERASNGITRQASAQLEVIAQQIRQLQQAAKDVLAQARRDLDLHAAECRFRRIPGETYHLYRRSNGTLCFSIVSPQDYGEQPPHEFVGSYRLEYNDSWTPVDEIEEREREQAELRGYLKLPGRR